MLLKAVYKEKGYAFSKSATTVFLSLTGFVSMFITIEKLTNIGYWPA